MSLVELPWPSASQPALAGQLFAAWMLMSYTLAGDDIDTHEPGPRWLRTRAIRLIVRALIVGVFALLLARPTVPAMAVGGFLATVTAGVPLARLWLHRTASTREAEFEISVVAGTAIVLWFAIIGLDAYLGWAPIAVPLSEQQIAGCAALVALGILLTSPSTLVVRGVLAKVGVAQGLDSKEYNRGRVIGVLERVLIAAVVAFGEYDALAFLVAAKGLIRSKELAKHDFAEYFLIGTFMSVLPALVVGLLAQAAIRLIVP